MPRFLAFHEPVIHAHTVNAHVQERVKIQSISAIVATAPSREEISQFLHNVDLCEADVVELRG